MTALPIQLPSGFFPQINVGDTVAVGDVLAQSRGAEEVLINIATQLRIPVPKAKTKLKKIPGDTVVVGEVLAHTKGLLGFSKTEVVSNVAGTVTRYERHTGNLAIRTGSTAQPKMLVSPVAGTISLCDNEKIVIETPKSALVAEAGIGETTTGEVMLLESSFSAGNQENLLYYLDGRTIGKIVVASFFTREMLLKGVGLGVKGLIGANIAENDLSYLAARKDTIPVLTVGVESLAALKQWQGRKVYLDGGSKSIIFLYT